MIGTRSEIQVMFKFFFLEIYNYVQKHEYVYIRRKRACILIPIGCCLSDCKTVRISAPGKERKSPLLVSRPQDLLSF